MPPPQSDAPQSARAHDRAYTRVRAYASLVSATQPDVQVPARRASPADKPLFSKKQLADLGFPQVMPPPG